MCALVLIRVVDGKLVVEYDRAPVPIRAKGLIVAEAQILAPVPTRAVVIIVAQVLMCALVLIRVEERGLAVEYDRAPEPIHVRVLIVAKAQILAPVLVLVATQTQAIVQGVAQLLILAKFINCILFADSIQ